MGDRKRIPFILNLDDPIDAAIWEQLEPLIQRHRASDFIRGALAQVLGIGAGVAPLSVLPVSQRIGLPSGSVNGLSTQRSVPRETTENREEASDNSDAREEAAANFLGMFG